MDIIIGIENDKPNTENALDTGNKKFDIDLQEYIKKLDENIVVYKDMAEIYFGYEVFPDFHG